MALLALAAVTLAAAVWWMWPEAPAPVATPVGLVRCPVEDGAIKANFGAPRAGHTHRGVDILAPEGTPVLAATDGVVTNDETPGGYVVTLTAPDGSVVVGKHLAAVTLERAVEAGEVIGYVGTLDSPRALPHLHFEWHPGGGPAEDAFPALSRLCD